MDMLKKRMPAALLAVLLCLLLLPVSAFAGGAEATLGTENLSSDGSYGGPVTLTAPQGYEIADVYGGAFAASLTLTPLWKGENVLRYTLRPSGDDTGRVEMTVTVRYQPATPQVALYGPTANAASGSGRRQKLVLALSEAMQPVAGKQITVTAGDASYAVDAATGTAAGGDLLGAWYAVYDMDAFSGLALAPAADYTVTIAAGAFRTAAGADSAAMTAAFSTAADDSLLPVSFTLGREAGWTARVQNGAWLRCGEGVASGTVVSFTCAAPAGLTAGFTMLKNGADAGAFAAVTADAPLEVYAAVSTAALSGTLSVSGTAAVGGELSAALTGSNETDPGRLAYVWTRGNVTVGTAASYRPAADDVGSALTLTVTSTLYTGSLTAASPVVTKASAFTKPAAPTLASATETVITLATVSGCEYRMDGGAWQTSPVFSGLAAGVGHNFTQRMQETTESLPSEESAVLTAKTVGPLTGAVTVRGALQVGVQLTASLTGSNNSGELTYVWKRGGVQIARGETYLLTQQDAGQTLTVEVTSSFETGVRSFTTAAVRKAAYTGASPAAPTLAAVTPTSVTLQGVSGYEYSRGGTTWQSSPVFTGLTAATSYYFYQRAAGTAVTEPSVTSTALLVATPANTVAPALTGTLSVSGEVRFGQTLVASVTGGNNTGTLQYVWKVGGVTAGSGSTYAIQSGDMNRQITLEVTSSAQTGALTKAVGTVQKSLYIGELPPAPTRKSRTTTSITLTAVSGCEYSRDGKSWQSGTTFSGLSAGKTYTFYQRYKATSTMEASAASDSLQTSTLTSGSGSTPASSAKTPTPTPKATAATPAPTAGTAAGQTVGAQYVYTPGEDGTRILYSTMQNLVATNKTQDVVIRLKNASFTFQKGTMQLGAEQAWYDYGVDVNDCIHVEAGQRLAGNAYVATVHYHYSGALPAEAEIRLYVGTQYAGSTFAYARLDSTANTLTYLCDAPVDADGYALVRQTSCSDYVLSKKDTAAGSGTPDPATAGSPSPSSSPASGTLVSPADDGNGSGGLGVTGWVVTGMIVAALALVAVGVYLYYRNREE